MIKNTFILILVYISIPTWRFRFRWHIAAALVVTVSVGGMVVGRVFLLYGCTSQQIHSHSRLGASEGRSDGRI